MLLLLMFFDTVNCDSTQHLKGNLVETVWAIMGCGVCLMSGGLRAGGAAPLICRWRGASARRN